MSNTNLSQPPAPGAPNFDRSLLEFLENIRKDVNHLLRPDQADPPAPADLGRGLDTLKTAADATVRLVEKERMRVEVEKIKAECERVKEEKERLRVEVDKIKAETERIKADKEKVRAETDRLTAETEKIKAQKR